MDTSALRLCVVLVVVLLVVSGGVGAVPSPRDQPADTSPPVRVFVGETLDVSGVELTGGGTVGSSDVTLVGVAGDAEGRTETIVDPTDADFGAFASGTYDATSDGDDRPEFAVVEPRVTRVVVRNQNGANVTNGWEPTGESLTVTVDYNFAEVDRLDVTVRDPDGIDVTDGVASADRIATSGGSVRLNLGGEEEGTFRIILKGSDLDDARQVVTVRTGPRRTATPLPPATVTTEPPMTEPTEAPQTTTQTDTPTERPETPTATETQPITPSPTDVPTERPETPTATGTETSTPGFGLLSVVAALIAIGVAVGRLRRQQ